MYYDDLDLEIIRIKEMLKTERDDINFGITPKDDYENRELSLQLTSHLLFIDELERELDELYKIREARSSPMTCDCGRTDECNCVIEDGKSVADYIRDAYN